MVGSSAPCDTMALGTVSLASYKATNCSGFAQPGTFKAFSWQKKAIMARLKILRHHASIVGPTPGRWLAKVQAGMDWGSQL